LSYPSGIYYDEDNEIFYISNEDAHSIIQWYIGSFDRHYIYAGIPGRPGNSSIQLNHPQGITLDKHGNLYVADTLNNRIQMFCPNAVEGITIAGATQAGNSSEELNNPRDINFDSEMNLYVSDAQNSRIQKFQRIP
jgi:DNA-binding beta-propeller fold protein YncE